MTARETEGGTPVRALIVDDEPLARAGIRSVLEAFDRIRIVAESGDGAGAVRKIRAAEPDLVLLDIQMPGGDGFSVIEEVGVEAMPAVVFVTAYDAHAIRAFEVHALDYVLKPFDDERLAEAVEHALSRLDADRGGELGRRLEEFFGELPPALAGGERASGETPTPIRRILVRSRDELRFVPVADVDWFGSSGNYVEVHAGDDEHLIRATLTGLAARLDPRTFVRIHRSTIVNVERIRKVRPWGGGDYVAVLDDGTELRVSRTYADDLLRPLS